MEFDEFFLNGFVADELADALLELGRDDLIDESNSKADLARHLAELENPPEDVLAAFYNQALANACLKFGLPATRKAENIGRLVEFLEQSGVLGAKDKGQQSELRTRGSTRR